MELKKKKIGMYFFKCFPLLEKKKKKIFVDAEPFLGYCPNDIVEKIFCISIEGIVLQECIAMWWA